MKILVTGSAGFIGFHLVQHLVNCKYDVTGLDNINDYYSINLKYDRLKECGIEPENIIHNKLVTSTKYLNYKFIKADLEDTSTILEIFKNEKFEIVVNLAAQAGVRYSIENPKAYIKSNIDGFLNILEACKAYPPKKLLYASSSSVYGANVKQPFSTEDKVETPVSIYAATKKTNELMAHVYSHLFDITTVGLRFFTVYGPWGRPDMAPFLFGDAISKNKPIKVFNNGNMKRDFTFIDDIINGISKLILAEITSYNIFNIGNGSPVDLMKFIACLENEFDKKSEKVLLEMQPGDLKETWADVTDLEALIAYKPTTSIEQGVKKFVNWYKEYYLV